MPPRKAFTLVELLVVVAILAVLIALLLPAMGKAKAATRAAVCRSNLSQVGVALMTYAVGHGPIRRRASG